MATPHAAQIASIFSDRLSGAGVWRRWLFGGALALLAAAAVEAGTIVGTVRARGPEDQEVDGAGGYGSRRYRFLERVDYDQLRDFVVHVMDVATPAPDQPPRASITQRDGEFSPRILPVVAGTVVEWPNADDIYHNVFSISEATPFDLGLYKRGGEPRRITFDRAGRVDVFCSIHAQMTCVVLVLPNPWFTVADGKGRFVIRDVPPGKYRLRAWHERLPAQVQEVEVPAEGEVRIDFLLSVGAPRS